MLRHLAAGESAVRELPGPAPGDSSPDPDRISAIVDSRTLRELAQETRQEAVADLIDSFLNDILFRAVRVSDAATDGDIGVLERQALSLSGSCATFGALRLRDQALAIAQACVAGRSARAVEMAASVRQIADATYRAFAEQKDRFS
jgi:HPt (histidine-containing phosphotransfer) domain-containing protein